MVGEVCMGKVILICGMIGSGKTTYANKLGSVATIKIKEKLIN